MSERSGVTTTTFGELLKRLRKRAGMTQDDLAAATGYSRSLVGALERNDRLPDVEVVIQTYLPALGLQEEPLLAAQLVELAALARGERPPTFLPLKRVRHVVTAQEAQEGEEATHCFPVPPTEILGRDAEINDLCNRLLGQHGRLLTLVGPPGVGKTRLSQAVGAQLQSLYRDGACFVPLAAVSDPELTASALVSALGLHVGLARPPQSRLIEHLRRKEMLLVLDNFEQLISISSPAVAMVSDLLAECPGLGLLITSRERLHLRAEQRYHVQPLALAAAVDLFVRRCTAVDSDFALTDTNRPTIEAICEQMDRLPLAIELCAAQTDLLSLSQLLSGLRDRQLEMLVGGAQDLPPHQRTLRKAIEHSYNLLDAEERALFRSLGVFVGGCGLEEIEAVSAWTQNTPGRALHETLHALIGKSLVRVKTTPGGAARFSLLETIREFALEQARGEDEEDLLSKRHFEVYLQLFRVGDWGLRGLEGAAWLARLEAEHDNLRAALRWTLDEGRYADMAWLLLSVGWFWHQTGRWQESGGWMEQSLSHSDTLDAEVRLAILLHRWALASVSDDPRLMARCTDEAWGLLEVCSNQVMHSAAWIFTAGSSAGHAEAADAYERSIACARAAYDEPGLGPEFGLLADRGFVLGTPLRSYATCLIEHGEFARAAPLLVESSNIFRARGSRYEMADSIGTLGRLALLQGDFPKARALLHEAVTLAEAFKHQQVLGIMEPHLGFVSLYMGDAQEARRLLEDSLRICLELNEKVLLARNCAFLAETALWEGKLNEAEQWLAQSLAYDADPRRTDIYQIERFSLAARLATAQAAHLRAAALFGLAERIRSQIHYELVGPARRLADTALAAVRAALGPTRFAEAFAAGQQLSLEEAYAAISVSSSSTGAPPLLSHLSA